MVTTPAVSRLFIYTAIVAVIAGALLRAPMTPAHAPVATRTLGQPLS
jgi:hypothetical protein